MAGESGSARRRRPGWPDDRRGAISDSGAACRIIIAFFLRRRAVHYGIDRMSVVTDLDAPHRVS